MKVISILFFIDMVLVLPPSNKCNGRLKGRTSSAPISARRLEVDKVQGLRSGILTFTSLYYTQ